MAPASLLLGGLFETLRLRAVTTALGCFVIHAALASTAPVDDKPPIPADLLFEFKAVPASENAIIDWRRAAEISAPLNAKETHIVQYCWTSGAREPSSEELNELQSWLRRNKQALEIFNASLKRPEAQWPERDPQNPQPELKSLSMLIRARLFEADQFAEAARFNDAAKSLEESLKLSQSGIDADPFLFNYLVACRARTITQDAILRFSCRKQVPVPLLEELLKNLPHLDSETNSYDHALRVEFTHEYYNSLDLKKLTDNLSKMSGTNAVLYAAIYPNDLQRAFKVLLDPSLVLLHPKPYDENEEIEKSIEQYRIYRTNSLGAWVERNGEVELEHEEDHTNLVEDVAPLLDLVKDDWLPLSRQAAQKARAAYIEIDNPVGRILDSSVLGFVASDLKVCQCRTEREATRAFLALVIYQRKKGHLPVALDELVQEKILDAVPIDQFCGSSLHYSREARKIWSISDDGVDDNGTSSTSRWYANDAVWQIPELN